MGNRPMGRERNCQSINWGRLSGMFRSTNTNSTNQDSLEIQAVRLEEQAANLRKLSKQNSKANYFKAGFEPHIDEQACTHCGKCTEICRFGAITSGVLTTPLNCKGCGVCAFNCPEHAITMVEKYSDHQTASQ